MNQTQSPPQRTIWVSADALTNPSADDLDEIAVTMLFPSNRDLRDRARRANAVKSLALSSRPLTIEDRDRQFQAIRSLPDFSTEMREAVANGELSGHMLAAALLDGAKLGAAKAEAEAWGKKVGLRYGRSKMDEVWKQYRPVSHLWAARQQLEGVTGVFVRAIPCLIRELPLFVATAEALRSAAESFHPRQSPAATLMLPGDGYSIEARVAETVAKK